LNLFQIEWNQPIVTNLLFTLVIFYYNLIENFFKKCIDNFDGFLVSFNWRTEEFDGLYNEELMNTFPEINLSNQPENKLAIKEETPLNPSHKFANNNINNFDPSTTLFSPLLGLYAAKQQQEEKYSSSQLSRDVNKKNKDTFNSIENRQSSSSSKSNISKVNKRNKAVSNDNPPEKNFGI